MGKRQSKRGFQAIGYGLAIAQAAFYSTLGIFGKLVYATGIGAGQAIVLRFFSATVLLGLFILVTRRCSFISRERSVYLQAVFFCVSSIFYFLTVERLTAGLTTVIFYTYPAVVAIAGLFVFKEPFSLPIAIALGLAIVGLVFISGMSSGEVALDPLGILYGIVSCLAFAIYTILIQKTGRREDPLTVTFTLSWTSLLASCLMFFPSVPGLVMGITPYQLLLGVLMALFATILPIFIYIEAIKRIGGTKSSLIGISELPFSLLIAFIVLGETLTLEQGIGSCLIVASIAIVTIAPIFSSRKAQPDP